VQLFFLSLFFTCSWDRAEFLRACSEVHLSASLTFESSSNLLDILSNFYLLSFVALPPLKRLCHLLRCFMTVSTPQDSKECWVLVVVASIHNRCLLLYAQEMEGICLNG